MGPFRSVKLKTLPRRGIQNFSLAIACALIGTGTGLLFFVEKKLLPRLASLRVFALLGLLLWQAAPLDRAMTAWNHPGIVATHDSPYRRITVRALAGQTNRFYTREFFRECTGRLAPALSALLI